MIKINNKRHKFRSLTIKSFVFETVLKNYLYTEEYIKFEFRMQVNK